MEEKPMIRHCINCQWHCNKDGYYDCQVRYTDIPNILARLIAWLCRFYKQREEQNEEE